MFAIEMLAYEQVQHMNGGQFNIIQLNYVNSVCESAIITNYCVLRFYVTEKRERKKKHADLNNMQFKGIFVAVVARCFWLLRKTKVHLIKLL